MSDYRRWCAPGGTYFFTLVTERRRPILVTDLARRCLHDAIDEVRGDWPFELVAIVLLPDHLHAIWTLESGDDRYAIRWKRIKEEFTRRYLERGGEELPPNASRLRHQERGIWQRRYWEHCVRDEDDLKQCVDYIHWNPRKHSYVSNVRDWPWSSFRRFVALGEYTLDWGVQDPTPGYDDPEWGE
ncbi:MAG: transposase [Thermoguttaceae bacterium]